VDVATGGCRSIGVDRAVLRHRSPVLADYCAPADARRVLIERPPSAKMTAAAHARLRRRPDRRPPVGEHLETYLRWVFGFIGTRNPEFISADVASVLARV